MGWYRYSSSVKFRRRMPITVDNSAGVAATSVDVEVTIPKDWEEFWSVIDASGANIRVTGPDGVTLVTYDVDDGAGGAFSTTTRAGRIRIDGYTVPTSTVGMYQAFVYFDPDGSVTAGDSVVTMTSTVSGYIHVGLPRGDRRFPYVPQTPGSTRPRTFTHKAPSEQVDVWVAWTNALEVQRKASEDSRKREELYYFVMSVENTAGTDQTSMYTLSACRFVETPDGKAWTKLVVKAGTTATNYTIAPTVHSVAPYAPTVIYQTRQPRIGLAVRATRIEV